MQKYAKYYEFEKKHLGQYCFKGEDMEKEKSNRNENYNAYVESKTPKSKMAGSLIRAFVTGGLICAIGQGFYDLYAWIWPNLSQTQLSTYMLITIIFLASLFTAIGFFDRIGAFGGAGSVIPITGFSNSITSPALEFKHEGIIFGICVKMFTIAGPVIVLGIAGSVVAGLIALII